MTTLHDKALRFQRLHRLESAFIIPNPWDPGTARLLEQAGFKALATTGAGYAFSQGRVDGSLGRETMLEYARSIVDATELPVSADFENGFGDAPETVAETIRLGIRAGLVGGSIEDLHYDGTQRERLEPSFACERIRAAVETIRGSGVSFTLTARCENFITGHPDLADTIRRLQCYQEAGADVLYAPGLTAPNDIQTLVQEVDRPVNIVAGLAGVSLSQQQLSALGVKRISLGSTLTRTALTAFMQAVHEMCDSGTFSFAEQTMSYAEFNRCFEGP